MFSLIVQDDIKKRSPVTGPNIAEISFLQNQHGEISLRVYFVYFE